jgi:molecular chaperone GrpE
MSTDPRASDTVEPESVGRPKTPGANQPPADAAATARRQPPSEAHPTNQAALASRRGFEGEPGARPDSDSDSDADLEAEAEAVLAELTAKAEKADEYLGLAQRTKADFENYRRRAMRDAALAQDRGIAKLARELLPAIDNLDRAVTAVETHTGDSHEQLVSGIKLVHAEVISAFARAGVEPFSPEGEPFDPQWHEAVAQQPFEGHAPGTVVEVYQRGYKIGDTVLRPARVLVAA